MDMSKINRRYFLIIFLLCVLLVIGVELAGFYYVPMVHTPTELYVKKGSSIRTVVAELTQRQMLTNPRTFMLLARWQNASHLLRAGEYEIPAETTASQLLQQLVAGKVRMRDIKIIEGWQLRQVLTAMHQNSYLEHNLLGKSLPEITTLFGQLEGNLFPDTYLFARGTSETEVLTNAKKLMTKQLDKEWTQRAANLPYKTADEALVVASLIEKETAVNAERTQIAGVILRRLAKNMPLQIDPTVIYALGEAYTGKLHKDDMSIDSPYNTYKSKGLPPTPIAMPGLASINAAMHPAEGTSLYYV
ncbi:MAG: endolytic transglycosylase MltG, partial [Pseudomonadota bacterium]|nr:endolytic transglycosylase MltG [Pseudomonadota bacterium]